MHINRATYVTAASPLQALIESSPAPRYTVAPVSMRSQYVGMVVSHYPGRTPLLSAGAVVRDAGRAAMRWGGEAGSAAQVRRRS